MKTFFFCIVFVCSLVVNAQITKGNWLVGGDATFNNSKVLDNDGNEISRGHGIRINANFGYFLLNNFAAGLVPRFNYGNTEGRPSSSGYGIGPFTRYYFLKSEKSINVFADANIIYSSSKTEGFSRNHNSSYRIKLGTAIFFNSSVALEFAVGYHSANFSTVTNTIELGFGFQIHLEK